MQIKKISNTCTEYNEFISCACSDKSHLMVAKLDIETKSRFWWKMDNRILLIDQNDSTLPDLCLSLQMNNCGFFSRIWEAICFVFCKNSNMDYWFDFMFNITSAKRLRRITDMFIEEAEKNPEPAYWHVDDSK